MSSPRPLVSLSPVSQCRGRGLMRANAKSLLPSHPNFFSHNICKLTLNLEKMSNIELYIHLDNKVSMYISQYIVKQKNLNILDVHNDFHFEFLET